MNVGQVWQELLLFLNNDYCRVQRLDYNRLTKCNGHIYRQSLSVYHGRNGVESVREDMT